MRILGALTLIAAAARIAFANNIVTIFLPDHDPWPSWQGEVHGIDATATTYLIHCVGPDARNCAVRPNLTVTQGPSTLAYTDTGDYPGAVTLTARCDLPAETSALVTCPNEPGFTFTLPYASMNPQLVEITKTTWYNGPPTATPTGRDPATASLFGSGTGRVGGVNCGGAIFCGGFFGPVETGAAGGLGGGLGGELTTPSTTAAPTSTKPNAEFESAVAAVAPFVTGRISASNIVAVIPVYDSGGTLVVGSDAPWGKTTVSIGPDSSEDTTRTATPAGTSGMFSSGDGLTTTRPATATTMAASIFSGGAAAATVPADVATALLPLGAAAAAGLAAIVL